MEVNVVSYRVKQGKALLELRNWTGSFQHTLFHILRPEVKRQAHVHILPTHSFCCQIKYKMLGRLAHSEDYMTM